MSMLPVIKCLFFTLSFLLFIGIVVGLVLGPVWLARRGRRQYLASRPAGFSARMVESIALVGLGVAMLTIFVKDYQGKLQESPFAIGNLIPSVEQADFWIVVASLSVIAIAWFLIAWFRHTVWAFVALSVLFCSADRITLVGQMLGYRIGDDQFGAKFVPIEITLPNQIAGADVWVNNVHLGKTPIHTTAAALQEIPEWKDVPKEWREEEPYVDDQGSGSRSFLRLPLRDPDWDKRNSETERVYFFRAEFNGEKMYGNGASSTGGRFEKSSFGQPGTISPGHIELRMFLPRWKKEVAQLLQRARLANYQVDDAWITAAESYDDQVWRAMRRASVDEPEFNQDARRLGLATLQARRCPRARLGMGCVGVCCQRGRKTKIL